MEHGRFRHWFSLQWILFNKSIQELSWSARWGSLNNIIKPSFQCRRWYKCGHLVCTQTWRSYAKLTATGHEVHLSASHEFCRTCNCVNPRVPSFCQSDSMLEDHSIADWERLWLIWFHFIYDPVTCRQRNCTSTGPCWIRGNVPTQMQTRRSVHRVFCLVYQAKGKQSQQHSVRISLNYVK